MAFTGARRSEVVARVLLTVLLVLVAPREVRSKESRLEKDSTIKVLCVKPHLCPPRSPLENVDADMCECGSDAVSGSSLPLTYLQFECISPTTLTDSLVSSGKARWSDGSWNVSLTDECNPMHPMNTWLVQWLPPYTNVLEDWCHWENILGNHSSALLFELANATTDSYLRNVNPETLESFVRGLDMLWCASAPEPAPEPAPPR